MTITEIRTEALKQFASLTRHAPKELDAGFSCIRDGDDLTLAFGKRTVNVTLQDGWEKADTLDLKPAAMALYKSA